VRFSHVLGIEAVGEVDLCIDCLEDIVTTATRESKTNRLQPVEISSCAVRQRQATINVEKEVGSMLSNNWCANAVAMATCSKKVFTTLEKDA